MRLADADGRPRIDAARDAAQRLQRELAAKFRVQLLTFGDSLSPRPARSFEADASRSDLSGALTAVRERFRDRRLAGIVVISDGGDTGSKDAAAEVMDDGTVSVHTIGVGSPQLPFDLEVTDVSAGEGTLTDSSVDLTVSAVSRGAATPFDVRVLENGRLIDFRKVTPPSGEGPAQQTFSVSPSRETATLYTVEIPPAAGELVKENNRRSVLVEPPGPRRPVLIVEGAPGFEHAFMKRVLAADPGIELDAIVRKGRDGQGNTTYYVQAAAARAPQLLSGFPVDRESLFRYDALILANVDVNALSRAQLALAADFVGDRGGGLLVLGAKSFAQQGLAGTPVEEALPMGLSDRSSGVVRASVRPERFGISLTRDGERHPVMRIGMNAEDTVRQWKSVPALTNTSSLGAPHPGAQVLALTSTEDGLRPLIAVQRYGQGRSMIFAGEASWRWRMQLPAEDRTYELFWRQTARWLASASPSPVSIAPLSGLVPGDTAAVGVDVRDPQFAPVSDAQVVIRVIEPDGEIHEMRAAPIDPRAGRFVAQYHFRQAGVARISVNVTRGDVRLGAAERSVLVGAADLEMSDPRLNDSVLRRVSRASGGEYVGIDDVGRLTSLLSDADGDAPPPRLEELWHNGWMFAAVLLLLTAEWILRRRWGLR